MGGGIKFAIKFHTYKYVFTSQPIAPEGLVSAGVVLRYDFGGKSKGYPNVAQRLKTIPQQAQERVALEQRRNYLNNRVSELESEKETIADERDLLAKKLEETLVIEEEKFISIYFEHQDVDNGVEKSRITFKSNGIVKDTQNKEARRVDVSWIVRKSATK